MRPPNAYGVAAADEYTGAISQPVAGAVRAPDPDHLSAIDRSGPRPVRARSTRAVTSSVTS